MKLSSILLSRTIAFLDTIALNPRNRLSYIDIAKAMLERYKFAKIPEKIEDYDLQKGVEFVAGKLDGITIERVTLFTNGIVVDTRSSTDDSDRILEDGLQWFSHLTGLPSPPPVTRRCHISQLTYYSEIGLPLANPHFIDLSNKISELVSKPLGQQYNYEVYSLSFNFDQTKAKWTPGPFTIERAADIPFSENKYTSIAPLSTTQHLALLEEFESALKAKP
jgi:hypothetical protein